MKFGVVVFPGSNCDRDMYDALKYDLGQEVIMLWHKDKDLSRFTTEDCIILPGGFSYGDYLRCGAIAGICNTARTIFGMMPHPERACSDVLGNTDGREIIRTLIMAEQLVY